MRKKLLKALLLFPFIAGGIALAMSAGAPSAPAPASGGYICPVTGEVLPSPECCPFRQK